MTKLTKFIYSWLSNNFIMSIADTDHPFVLP